MSSHGPGATPISRRLDSLLYGLPEGAPMNATGHIDTLVAASSEVFGDSKLMGSFVKLPCARDAPLAARRS